MRKLYYVNGSISSWRVALALHEKGLVFEGHRMRVMSTPKPTRQPVFLALNPRGKAPVLVDEDGCCINESLAILSWLELRYPQPSLLAATPQGQATALAWAQESEEMGILYEPIEQLFLTPVSELSEAQAQAIQAALLALKGELALWEGRLQQKNFLVDAQLGLADCAFYPGLAYMERRGLLLDDYPALKTYSLRLRQRPAAIAAFPEGWTHKVGKINLFRLAAML